MRIVSWAGLMAAAALMAGCGNFWQAPNTTTTTGFALSNSGSIAVSSGSTGTETITVTPGSSFTGTVTLSCAVTTRPSGATSSTDPTCSLSSTSLTFSSTTTQNSTLTATAGSTTGAYQLTVTGVSGSTTETTQFCVAVGTSTSSCTSTASSGVFYVLNQTTNQIAALSIASGQLTTIGTYTTPTSTPLAIAVAPNKNFLYVSTNSGIYLYSISSTGALTLGNSGTRISQDHAYTMQVDATDSWLVEAISGLAQLNAININSTSGELATANETEQSVALPASTPVQLAISPNDSSSCTDCYVFVAMGDGGTEIINFNPSPSGGNPFGAYGNQGLINTSIGGANTVAVDPTNRLLYIGETSATTGTQTGGLRVFKIASNGITELTSAGSPYTTGGTGPNSIQPSADGNYVYVANKSVSGSSSDNITSFSVASNATGLTSIGTVAAGPAGVIGLAEDSTGNYLLAVDFSGSPDLQAFSMSSGTLTSVFTGKTGTDPVGAIAIASMP